MGLEMFLKEARKMNRADAIPQVVHVLDMFQDNQTTYIIMNCVHGETLAKKVAINGPMSWQKVREILLQVAETMQKVHDTGLIHRDLSPDNLMIQPDSNVMILDLGAAKDQRMHGSVSSMQVARGGFSPMEQYAMSGNLGTRTDVYSLSASVYYALTGVIPPSAVDQKRSPALGSAAVSPCARFCNSDSAEWYGPSGQGLNPEYAYVIGQFT